MAQTPLKERTLRIIKALKKEYPDSRCSLYYKTPFQLLIATILSAQCTDERVNKTTPALFKKFPDAKSFAKADIGEIETLIRSTGFYKSKAKSIQETSKMILMDHGGELPRDIESLVKLRGVGRKTANVLLGNAFGIQSGVVVDTHVGRLTRRMGLTKQKDPVKVEQDLVKLVPQDDWTIFSHLMIDHGRAICSARKPLCDECMITQLCPQVGV